MLFELLGQFLLKASREVFNWLLEWFINLFSTANNVLQLTIIISLANSDTHLDPPFSFTGIYCTPRIIYCFITVGNVYSVCKIIFRNYSFNIKGLSVTNDPQPENYNKNNWENAISKQVPASVFHAPYLKFISYTPNHQSSGPTSRGKFFCQHTGFRH